MAQNTATEEVEWESEIEYGGDDEYDRTARGKLIIDGPDGRLIVLKRYRAMIEESKGLMEPGKISEHSKYYREGESDPFDAGDVDWHVPEETLRDEDAFVEDCLAAVEADPQIEYEQHADKLSTEDCDEMFEHGLETGDVVSSKRRETDMEVQGVTDLFVDFGGDVGEMTHETVAIRLGNGVWEVEETDD